MLISSWACTCGINKTHFESMVKKNLRRSYTGCIDRKLVQNAMAISALLCLQGASVPM
jgi:hypothetical protein